MTSACSGCDSSQRMSCYSCYVLSRNVCSTRSFDEPGRGNVIQKFLERSSIYHWFFVGQTLSSTSVLPPFKAWIYPDKDRNEFVKKIILDRESFAKHSKTEVADSLTLPQLEGVLFPILSGQNEHEYRYS